MRFGKSSSWTLPTAVFVFTATAFSADNNVEYIIWPKEAIPNKAIPKIADLIAHFAGGPSKVHTSSGEPYSRVLYWLAEMPERAIKPIEDQPDVLP